MPAGEGISLGAAAAAAETAVGTSRNGVTAAAASDAGAVVTGVKMVGLTAETTEATAGAAAVRFVGG